MSNLSRRSILKLVSRAATVTGLAAVVGPIIAYFYPAKLEEMPTEPVSAGSADDIPEGISKVVPFGRYPALVINVPGVGLRAYSAVCTHFGCIVKWNPDTQEIDCPCHEGYFDPADGSVLSGPPPKPLLSLQVTVENDTVYIGGTEA